MNRPFEVICEIEPPTGPDLKHARHQIGVLSPVADAFLIPDNHIGRATVSSIAVAHEVQAMGGNTIACLNSRDRNLLGFRRDLLTAAAYGVSQFLFVYGDKPSSGGRTSDLTVRSMIDEARRLRHRPGVHRSTRVADRGRRLPAAPAPLEAIRRLPVHPDQLLGSGPLRWRDANPVDIPVYAGVMVLASADMARRLAASIPDIDIPQRLIDQVAADKAAGVDAACEQIRQLRDSGAIQGVHLVPVGRYREVSARLEALR